MKVIETKIKDCKILQPEVFNDERGYFLETFNKTKICEIIGNYDFVQDNHSHSKMGTLRGLHFQTINPQGKLVSVLNGEVFDVAVDLRKESPSYGEWVRVILSDYKKQFFWIPPGFAHGFQVISKSADFLYKCTEYYDAYDQQGIKWNDKTLNIKWPVNDPIISKKDKNNPSFKDLKL
tara:strand:+ start:1496 stop:2029 length:534 start_codon:yes stop_codon:yes gene_type:complete